MLRMNTTRNTRAAPQPYEEALAALGFRGRDQAMPTLLDEWEHQTSASGSLQPQGSLLDQFHSVTPGAIALRRLRHLREVVGWIRKL